MDFGFVIVLLVVWLPLGTLVALIVFVEFLNNREPFQPRQSSSVDESIRRTLRILRIEAEARQAIDRTCAYYLRKIEDLLKSNCSPRI